MRFSGPADKRRPGGRVKMAGRFRVRVREVIVRGRLLGLGLGVRKG
jgi:hypothetical protein